MFDENKISIMSEEQYKALIKDEVRKRALTNLIESEQNYNKINMIKIFDQSKPQPYLLSSEFDNQIYSLLLNIRSRTVKGIKGNISTQFKDDKQCNLCDQVDIQEHILNCHISNVHLAKPSYSEYGDILGPQGSIRTLPYTSKRY